MSDLISREEAVDILCRLHIDNIAVNGKRITEFIKEIPSVTDTNVGNKWIPCSERLPEEHDSIFKKYKGTDKWDNAMFESISGEVNVTVEYLDGTRKSETSHTVDGKWSCEKSYGLNKKVIAWMPLPPEYKGEQGVSFIGIRETAFFSLDLQKEANEYARKKESEGWKITEAYTGSGYSVTSEYSISFIKGEQEKGEQHEINRRR